MRVSQIRGKIWNASIRALAIIGVTSVFLIAVWMPIARPGQLRKSKAILKGKSGK
jgi:hypothetical protein